MSVRDEKIISQLMRLAAEFLVREAGKQSLITVTDCSLADNGQHATLYISVLPEEEAGAALNFVKRRRTELKKYIQNHLRIKRVPFLDFALERKNSNNS